MGNGIYEGVGNTGGGLRFASRNRQVAERADALLSGQTGGIRSNAQIKPFSLKTSTHSRTLLLEAGKPQ